MCSLIASTVFCVAFWIERDEQVEIADSFFSSAQGTGDGDRFVLIADALNVRNQFLRGVLSVIQTESSRRFLEVFSGGQNVLFGFFAEAIQETELAFFGEFFYGINRASFKSFPEDRNFLRSERMKLQHLQKRCADIFSAVSREST